MSEEFERSTQPSGEMDPPSKDPPTAVGTDEVPDGGGGPRRALPARTSGRRPGWLAEWLTRTLDTVDMLADRARETLLGIRGPR